MKHRLWYIRTSAACACWFFLWYFRCIRYGAAFFFFFLLRFLLVEWTHVFFVPGLPPPLRRNQAAANSLQYLVAAAWSRVSESCFSFWVTTDAAAICTLRGAATAFTAVAVTRRLTARSTCLCFLLLKAGFLQVSTCFSLLKALFLDRYDEAHG